MDGFSFVCITFLKGKEFVRKGFEEIGRGLVLCFVNSQIFSLLENLEGKWYIDYKNNENDLYSYHFVF